MPAKSHRKVGRPPQIAGLQELPDTERQLEELMVAVEEHMHVGSLIGDKMNTGDITRKDALDIAAQADEGLYIVLERIQKEREDGNTEEGEED